MGRAVAFLMSQHPAINHALLLREVRQLRELGLNIRVASIRGPDRPLERLTAEERAEAKETYYVKTQGFRRALTDNLYVLLSRPAAYLRGLVYALRIGNFHPRRTALLLAYFTEAVLVGRWMERNGLTRVHAQYCSTVALLAWKIFPVEISVGFHGPDEFEDVAGFRIREKVAACRFVRAISYYSRSQLMKSSAAEDWDKIEIAYLGVDPESFAPRRFRPDPDPLEVLCVGRVAPVKAQRMLIAAVEMLARQGKSVRLNIAGGGPDREALAAMVRAHGLDQHVILHGWVSEPELNELYRNADVFALASFAEGVPGVLMEAMAMEIPCVATWITGVPELIRNGRDGLLVAPSDAEALAEAIGQLADDADLRLRLGKAGRQRVMEKFHLRRNAEILAACFRRYWNESA